MADVSKIQGPSGAPESAGKKDKPAVDADKFKQAMHKRVTEVSQVDPDEQKKRKRREESEEEEDLSQVQTGPTTPASQVTPFSLEQGSKQASPLDMQSGGAGTSPMAGAQPAAPSPPSSTFFLSSAPDEMSDDSGVAEQESFIENIPSASTPGAPGAAVPPPSQAPGAAVPQGQPIASSAPESGQNVTPQADAAQQKSSDDSSSTQAQPGGKKGKGAPKGGVTADALEGTPASKVQDTTKFFEHLGADDKEKKKGKTSLETPEEMEEEAETQGVGTPGQVAPFNQALEGKEAKDAKKVDASEKGAEMETTGLSTGMGDSSMMANLSPPPPESLPSYANLSPHVMELYDRMVGVMTVMTMSGMTETTVTLNMPQFASSVFFGTQIIIQEFSTAPKAFNVQLNGTPQAVALFQGNADDLMAAFQSGNYNYRINRLDTGYLSERPLFKRKEKIADKEKDTGENP